MFAAEIRLHAVIGEYDEVVPWRKSTHQVRTLLIYKLVLSEQRFARAGSAGAWSGWLASIYFQKK